MIRHDLGMVASTTRGTMKAIQSKKGKQQKFAIGDQSGTLHVFQVKKGEGSVVFKAPPNKREVTALCVGGSKTLKEKIYVAFGQTVMGYKKKGGSFFTFHPLLNEDISRLWVEENMIWIASENIVNSFDSNQSLKETNFYMAGDRINDMVFAPITSKEESDAVVGCQDRMIRVLKGDTLIYDCRVEGPVNSLIALEAATPSVTAAPEAKAANEFRQIVYGTDNGVLGVLHMDQSSVRKALVIPNDQKKASITAIAATDVLQNGVPELVIGRDDGTLELMSVHGDRGPQQLWSRELSESITSVDTGMFIGTTPNEMIVSTYSGKMFCYAPDASGTRSVAFSSAVTAAPESLLERKGTVHVSSIVSEGAAASASASAAEPAKKAAPVEAPESKAAAAVPLPPPPPPAAVVSEIALDEKKIANLQAELTKLQKQLSEAKEKVAKTSAEVIAVEEQFKIKQSFKLLADEACYLLTLEIQIPIDVVTLQSSVRLMLMDVASNNAMCSRTYADEKSEGTPQDLLATYRCQENTTRLEIKIRTLEGQYGPLNAFVVSRVSPKTCQKTVFTIRPLSLHERVDVKSIEEALASRPHNKLTLTGGFTFNEAHSWMLTCLPDVPAKLGEETAVMAFRSTFLNTCLLCKYQRGRAELISDSVTTTAILKEVITREATSRKTSMDVNVEVNEESVVAVAELMRPLLDYNYSLARRESLIAPLQEIRTHEGEVDYLSSDYQEILAKADEIAQAKKSAPSQLEFLGGILTDLLVDKHKLQGKNHKPKLPALTDALRPSTYSFEALLAVLKS